MRLLGTLSVLSLVAALGVVATAHEQVGAATAPELPVALVGDSPDAPQFTGVTLLAQERPTHKLAVGDRLRLYDLSGQVSASGSRFTVRLDPGTVPADAVGPGGLVDFEIHLRSGTDLWVTSATARLIRDEMSRELLWVDPVEEVSESSGVEVARVADGRTAAVRTVPNARRLHPVRLQGEALVRVPPQHRDARQRGRAASPGAAADICETAYRGDSNRWTTIATSYPLGRTKAWLDVGGSRGGNYGVAFGFGDGTFKAGGTRFSEGGWSFEWTPSSVARSYRVQVNYHKYEKVGLCDGPPIQWRPHIETGGVTSNTQGITRPTWNRYCAPVPRGTWSRVRTDGKNYQFNAAVKFASLIGIDLSGEKSYSSHHELVYAIDGRPKKLCGNNDYPSLAGKLVERLR